MAQTTIGSSIFTVNPLAGERSFLLQPKLLPALSEIATLYALFISTVSDLMPKLGDKADKDIDPMELLPLAQPALESAGPVIARLCEKLGPNLKDIMRELLEGATMDGKPLYTQQGNPIDVLMQGRTLDIWKLIVFAMGVSYPDFFGLLRGFGKKSAGAKPSETLTT